MVVANRSSIFSFVLSFLVIARFWTAHHELFTEVAKLTRPLVFLNLAWLLTIVFLPYPTEIVGEFDSHQYPFVVYFYIGTTLASSICQSVMAWILYKQQQRNPGSGSVDQHFLIGSFGATAGLLGAFVLIPLGTSYYGLLLLLIIPQTVSFFTRRTNKTAKTT
ncbi:TMEM175 family protein [Fodinicola feengrottensis]|nr:TMEM175 family protein [Fodinicola feengrottensis]